MVCGTTTAVSGAGPIPQKMQTERTPGVHSTAIVMPDGHFLRRTDGCRKAPTKNPRSPLENVTNPMLPKPKEVNGFSALMRQYSTMTIAVQIVATAAPSRKPRLRFTILPPHNDTALARRARDVRHETEPLPRRCLKQPG